MPGDIFNSVLKNKNVPSKCTHCRVTFLGVAPQWGTHPPNEKMAIKNDVILFFTLKCQRVTFENISSSCRCGINSAYLKVEPFNKYILNLSEEIMREKAELKSSDYDCLEY